MLYEVITGFGVLHPGACLAPPGQLALGFQRKLSEQDHILVYQQVDQVLHHPDSYNFV